MDRLLGELFRHNTWATLRLIDFCAALSDEQLDARATGTYGSVRDTLLHIVVNEERYLALLTGAPIVDALRREDGVPSLVTLREHAQRSGDSLIDVAERANPTDRLRGTWQGRAYDMRVAVPLIQAINHATEHRAHVATVLSQAGIEPPALDGWAYDQATSTA